MPLIHWVARQNKLETPKEKDEVNKREVHEYNGRVRDPDVMVRYSTGIWSRKRRNESCGGWVVQKTKGPECK
jgi:hypothetical protein